MSAPTSDPFLHRKVLLGLVLGALAGGLANSLASGSPAAREWVNVLADGVAHPIGQIFLRLLFLVVVPLVFTSLVVGVAGLGDLSKLGRIGGKTLLFFLSTTAISVVIGLTLLNTFQPGTGFDAATKEALMVQYGSDAAALQAKAEDQNFTSVLDGANKLLNMFLPRNMLEAAVSMDMLPVIVFALLMGCALTLAEKSRRERMVEWMETVGGAMVTIVGFAMKLAPYAVFCLIFSVIAKFGFDLLGKLAMYMALVVAGYLILLLGLFPLLIRVLCQRSPIEFMRKAMPIVGTALSTSSSNATLPTSIRITQSELGVRPSVAGFVLPLGATMNMNGTALFEGAVVLFVAQVFGIELTLAQQAVVVLLCVFSAVGAAGVPGGSLPLIMIVMAQVGVPPDGIAIILGVDRLLDMGRTVVNVMGDVVCAAWIERGESSGASTA
jgi:DAACS family dicarboxylate/amino acid:cation (Na+ or H+) symporter